MITGAKSRGGGKIFMLPRTLYDAMCLMLVDEVTGGIKMQACTMPACKEWFPFRRNKKFCSDKCRVYFSRIP